VPRRSRLEERYTDQVREVPEDHWQHIVTLNPRTGLPIGPVTRYRPFGRLL
jgi:hypothetical protein